MSNTEFMDDAISPINDRPMHEMYEWEENQQPWLISYERYNICSTIDMPDEQTSLIDMLEAGFAKHARQVAYYCDDQEITYEQLDKLSLKVAIYLQQLGLKVGDAIGVMLPNILQYPVITLGVIRAGMVLVSMNPSYTSRELEHQMDDADIKALFILDKFIYTYKDIADNLNRDLHHLIICRLGDLKGKLKGALINLVSATTDLPPKGNWIYFSQLLAGASKAYQRPNLTLSNIVLIQYTGGTTGTAKGAMLSHGNVIANLLQIDALIRSAYDEEGQEDIILASLPLYHVFSFTICCVFILYRGFASRLVPNPRDINELVNTLRRTPPHFILGVNTLFSALIQHPEFRRLDFSQLKATIGGGMAILPSVAKKWHTITGLPIIEGYGLSETAPVITFNPLTIAEFTNKVGLPTPATDIILLDNNDQPVRIGERGEIAVKGPQVMVGYRNLPVETANAFTATGYLRTGDIGIIDERGFIKIVDRKKDMIVVSGFNVYPNEIESVMLEHADVLECVAIGVPSATRGEEPKIFVVRKHNRVTAEQLLAFGKQHLSGYKRPRYVEFVDSLPKSNVGKILRKELRKREGLE